MPFSPDLSPQHAAAGLLKLHAFACGLARLHSLEDLLWNMADHIGELLGFEDCVIYLREGDVLVQAAAYGAKGADRHVVDPIAIPLGEGIVGAVAASGRPERIADTRLDPRYISDNVAGASELAVPITFGGEVIGVLDSECIELDGFTEQDQAMFHLLATLSAGRIAWLLSERRRRSEEAARHSERIEALGLLSAGVAHDFNNLLAVMALNVELARSAEHACARNEALQTLDQVVDRARGLTKQLVTFASGGAPIRALVDVQALLAEAVRCVSGSHRAPAAQARA